MIIMMQIWMSGNIGPTKFGYCVINLRPRRRSPLAVPTLRGDDPAWKTGTRAIRKESNMFIFRIYVSFNTPVNTGFDITLLASDEQKALAKAKKTVKGDEYIMREVTEKLLWKLIK